MKAAGDPPPLPCDVRPPSVLVTTLNYLVDEILGSYGLKESYSFVRDRFRSIRNDITIQNYQGTIAVEIFEVIARYHILCCYSLCEDADVNLHQEHEQLGKSNIHVFILALKSLTDMYAEMGHKEVFPNEAEFQAYSLLSQSWRDENLSKLEWVLRPEVFMNPQVQLAIEIRTTFSLIGQPDGSLNHYSRLFNILRKNSTPFLMACCVHVHFVEIRRKSLEAMNNVYYRYETAKSDSFLLSDLVEILGFDDEQIAIAMLNHYSLNTSNIDGKARVHIGKLVSNSKILPTKFEEMLNSNGKSTPFPPTKSKKLVEIKRINFTDVEIIKGSAHVKPLNSVTFKTYETSSEKLINKAATKNFEAVNEIMPNISQNITMTSATPSLPLKPSHIHQKIGVTTAFPTFSSTAFQMHTEHVNISNTKIMNVTTPVPASHVTIVKKDVLKDNTPSISDGMKSVMMTYGDEFFSSLLENEMKNVIIETLNLFQTFHRILPSVVNHVCHEIIEHEFLEIIREVCDEEKLRFFYIRSVNQICCSILNETLNDLLSAIISEEIMKAEKLAYLKRLYQRLGYDRWRFFTLRNRKRNMLKIQMWDSFRHILQNASVLQTYNFPQNPLPRSLVADNNFPIFNEANSTEISWRIPIPISDIISPVLMRHYSSRSARCKIVVFSSPPERQYKDTIHSLPYSWLKAKLSQNDSCTINSSVVLTNSRWTYNFTDIRLFVELIDLDSTVLPEKQVFLL